MQSGYDRKHMIRLICNSRAYQRSSALTPLNKEDESLFSHALIRRLSAEQLQDAVGLVTGSLRPAAEIAAQLQTREAELATALARMAADESTWEVTARDKVTELRWWGGMWHAVGPFPGNKTEGHDTAFPPEIGPDLTQSYEPGGLNGSIHPEWLENRTIDLGRQRARSTSPGRSLPRTKAKPRSVIDKQELCDQTVGRQRTRLRQQAGPQPGRRPNLEGAAPPRARPAYAAAEGHQAGRRVAVASDIYPA